MEPTIEIPKPVALPDINECCTRCAEVCERMAATAADEFCRDACLACAIVCRTCAADLTPANCRACIAACQMCGERCRYNNETSGQQCAAVCEECAACCRQTILVKTMLLANRRSPALPLLNRDFQATEDHWIHIVPLGVYDHSSGIEQVLDEQAAAAICNRFEAQKAAPNFPGLLVDFDHFSDNEDKPSEAAGWIDALDNRTDGVWGHVRWSDLGESAVKGGRYRLVSPVLDRRDAEIIANDSKKLRPTRLLKVALTNDPNLKGMVPLTNRAEPGGSADPNPQPQQKPTMKKLLTLLGLSAEASEDVAIEAVTKLQNRATAASQLEADKATLEKERDELMAAQVEHDLERFKNRIKADAIDAVRKQLLTNRAATLATLEALTEPTVPGTQQHLHNRAGAPTPRVDLSGDPNDDKARRERAAKGEQEIAKYQFQNRSPSGKAPSYDEARNMCRTLHPDLFIE